MTLMLRIVEHLLVSACLSSGAAILMSIAILLRLLPHLPNAIRVALRAVLILSFRLYRCLLRPLAPVLRRGLGIRIFDVLPRVTACVMLSLAAVLVTLRLADLPLKGWSIGIALLHGLAVGLTWDEIEKPGGLQLGVKQE
jgi:hypothetical protein